MSNQLAAAARQRVLAYINRRKIASGLDIERVHCFDNEFDLLLSDLVELVTAHEDSLREKAAKPEPIKWAISYDGKTPYELWHEGDGVLLDYEIKRLGGTAQKMALYAAPVPEAAKPESTAFMGVNPRTGTLEFCAHQPSPSVMRDFDMKPLYAAPVAAASPWLPIESAPKDGSLLLLKEKWEDEPFIGQWVSSAYGGKWAASRTHYDTDGNACVIDHVDSEGVTHWMPLPPAPEKTNG